MLKVFEYHGNQITFSNENGIMANATEMAKPFSKRPTDWIKTQQASEFIETLSRVKNIVLADLVIVKNGGNNNGTWLHQEVLIEFARWLSPEFSIWCNDRIMELGKHGMTATEETLEKMLTNPDLIIGLAQNLKKEREFRQIAETTIQLQAPKVEYHDRVLNSKADFTTTTIAKELGMSAQALNRKLVNLHIQFYIDGHYVLGHKYQNRGYTATRTTPYFDDHGVLKTSILTVWTESGRQFIHNLLNPVMKQKTA